MGLAEVINKLIFNNLHNSPPIKYVDTIINPQTNFPKIYLSVKLGEL
jgi:hypothetical protein